MDLRDAPDPVTAGFVTLCDEAIDEARKLLEVYRVKGDEARVDLAKRMVRFLEQRRAAALDGTMHRPKNGFAFGITRFADEYDWGPEGRPMIERVFDLQRYWLENM